VVELTVTRLEDVVFVPGYACLYDLAGHRIDVSMHLRDGRPLRRVTPRIDVPDDLRRITTPVVFGGHLPKHFGHFILESLSRLWAYTTHELDGVPLAHSRTVFHTHERELLKATLRPHGAPLLALTEPTLLSAALVPDQGIELGHDYHPAMLAVYDTIREELTGPARSSDDTPVYLSRTRLPGHLRATLGERDLEQRLARRGVRILHPQELALEEQLRVVAGARTVIGLEGTALHLTLFRALEGARTLALSNRRPEINQLRVDRLRGAENVHLRVQYPVHPRVPGLFGGRELRIGPYRSFMVPSLAERAILRELDA